jgi:hypothetical protein
MVKIIQLILKEQFLNDIKDYIRENNIDLLPIFNKYDADKSHFLSPKEFYQFLADILPNISELESNIVLFFTFILFQFYKKLDGNNDNNVSYKEFKRELFYARDALT